MVGRAGTSCRLGCRWWGVRGRSMWCLRRWPIWRRRWEGIYRFLYDLLLMASLLKFGALPPVVDASKPTAEELAAIRAKVKAYQEIFDTH